jgi:hypothetical protein
MFLEKFIPTNETSSPKTKENLLEQSQELPPKPSVDDFMKSLKLTNARRCF